MEKNILLSKYIIYGLIGICLEIFWTGLESLMQNNLTLEGTTYIWMFFIYGLAVFLEPFHEKIRDYNPLIRGSLYMIIIYCIELVTGLFLKITLGNCPWNYAGNGIILSIITPRFIPVWFTLGLIFERVHDGLEDIIESKLKA